MKILVALAAIFLVSTQLSAEEIGANDDLNYWSDWSDSDQIKEEMPEPFEHLLQRIARRPKPQQFFGLMGKRDAGHGQLSHKRHKTDSFVGLMGKRALNSVKKISKENMGKHVIYNQSGTLAYNWLRQGYHSVYHLQPSDPYPVVVRTFDSLTSLETIFPGKPPSADTHKHLWFERVQGPVAYERSVMQDYERRRK